MSILKSKISSFNSTRETEVVNHNTSTIELWLERFKNGTYKKSIEKLRATGDGEIKKDLPTVAFHGIFEHSRSKKSFIEASGIIILDIDDIDPDDNLEEIKQDIIEYNKSVLAVMISPSGDGLKILYLVEPFLVNADNYRQIGKQLVNDFTLYGKVDYLSVTDCLIATYDPNLLINENAVPAMIVVENSTTHKVEIEPLDKSKKLWDDAEDFFDTVLALDIQNKASNNFHYIQIAVFDMAKYGFKHPKEDLSFIIHYAEDVFKKSKDNQKRFNECVAIAKDLPHTMWAYNTTYQYDDFEDAPDYSNYMPDNDFKATKTDKSSGDDESVEENGLVDYSRFYERVLDVAREGNRVGTEISLKSFSNIFRFKGSGILTVTGIPGHGKAQPLSSLIYTPNGFKTMGEIKVGDEVLTKGGATKIVGVYPQGKKDVYKITFSDGTETRSCKEHLWHVTESLNRKVSKTHTVALSKIIDNLTFGRENRSKFRIPVEIAYFNKKELLIRPYLLGLLIGDGSLKGGTPRFTTSEYNIIEALKSECEPHNCKLTFIKIKNTYECVISKVNNGRGKSEIEIGIKNLKLDSNSYGKFIPNDYLYNSVENRMALLRGLLDTDGCVEKNGAVYLSTSSKRLAYDFQKLVQSLGGTSNISSKIPKYSYKGEMLTSKNRAYRITVNLPSSLGNPFYNSLHKVERYEMTKKNQPVRFIKSVVLESCEETQCIMVEDESHLYFTDNYIVTHNTEFVDQCILDLARLFKHETIIAGFEQTPEEHIIKLAKKLVGTDVTCPSYLKSNEKKLKEAVDFLTQYVKHIDVTKIGGNITKILEVSAKRIYESRENGGDPKYLILDPFNMLSIKSRSSGHEKIEEILRLITQFSHQMKVMVILVAHPFKMKKDEKTGKYEVPDFYSVKGSSAFFEMSYHGIVVHRTGYQSTDCVLVRILKVKQNNLGVTNGEVLLSYDRNSGRYIPIDAEGNEEAGDHRDKDWLQKAK